MRLSSLRTGSLSLALLFPAELALAETDAGQEMSVQAWIEARCPTELAAEKDNVFTMNTLERHGDATFAKTGLAVAAWMTVQFAMTDNVLASLRVADADENSRRALRDRLVSSVALSDCLAPDQAEWAAYGEENDNLVDEVKDFGRVTEAAREIIGLLDTDDLAGEALQARVTDTWEAAKSAPVEKN